MAAEIEDNLNVEMECHFFSLDVCGEGSMIINRFLKKFLHVCPRIKQPPS